MRDNNFGIWNNHWLIIPTITSLTNHSKLFWQIAPNWFEKCSLQIARRKITQVKINPAWQSHHHQYCRSGLQVKYIFRIWKVLDWALIPGKLKIVLTINSFLCKDCESFRAQSPLQLGKIEQMFLKLTMSEHVLTGAESDLTATDPKVYVCKFDDLNKNLNLVKFILAFSVPSGSDDMFTNIFASETSLHCRSQ